MSSKKNILMLAYTNYSTDARVIKEAEAAVESGYNVDFIALRRFGDKERETVNNVTVYHVKQIRYRGESNSFYILTYLEFFIRAFFKLTWLYMKHNYKLIHVNNIPDFLVFTAIFPKLLGTKIILDIHDPMPNTFLTKFYGNYNRFIYKLLLFQEKVSARFADHVITVHEPLKRDVLIKDGIPEEKITVISNFADERLFRITTDYIVGSPLNIIFYGTIAERFGFYTILSALQKVKQKEKVFLKIIGEGDFSGELKRLIGTFNLQNCIDFENTVYPVNELPEILKDYQIGIVSYDLSPATEYMLPVKMMELLSMGIPVITVQNKAVSYYFNENICFYYDPGNSQSLTRLIEEIINQPLQLSQMRTEILKHREKYLWNQESLKYEHLLKNLIY